MCKLARTTELLIATTFTSLRFLFATSFLVSGTTGNIKTKTDREIHSVSVNFPVGFEPTATSTHKHDYC
jgi:hypothetical protein